MTTGSEGAVPAGYWNVDITGGWMYLLPPLAQRRVLCISPRRPAQSASEASLFGELTLLHDARLDGVPNALDVANSGACAARWESLDSLLQDEAPARSTERRYDGLVIHDPQGMIVHRGNWPRLAALLRQLPKLLRPDAFVYLGVPNPRSLSRLVASLTRQARPAIQPPVATATLLDALAGAGFAEVRIHPYLAWGPTLAEVIPPRGYRASKNRERPAERFKELLFGRAGSHRFASAHGILACAGHRMASTLDHVFEQVVQAPYYQGQAAPVVKNYLLFPGSKAIVTFGPLDRDDHDLVGILTSDALAIERRNAEMAILSELAKLPTPLSQAVPRPLGQIAIGKTRCYLLNRIPGVTLDLESAALDQVTEQALDFVTNLHCASSQRTVMNEANYRKLFWALIEAAQERLPAVAAEFRALDAPLRACVLGAEFPTVWMHGDYKVENVMYDQRQRRLTGVIDWELARPSGLPLLDPLYLLIYNRQIRGEEHFSSIENVLWPQRRSDLEQAQLRRYRERLGLAENLEPALCAMFVAHHVGCRLHFRAGSSAADALQKLLPKVRAMLERAAALHRGARELERT